MTGAIFARGSCVALKWMTLLGAVLALTVAEAAAQNAVTLTMTGEYKPSTNTIELEFAGFDEAADTLYSSSTASLAGLFALTNAGTAAPVEVTRTSLDGVGRGSGGKTVTLTLNKSLASTPNDTRLSVSYTSTPARRILVMDADGTNGESDDDIPANITAQALEEIDVPPVLAPVPNKNYTVGVAITTETLPAATGGNTPTITYALDAQSNDDFPPGLAFSPTSRQLSGTPTEVGEYTVYYEATDDNANLNATGGSPNDTTAGDADSEAVRHFTITVSADTTVDSGDGMYGRVTRTWLGNESGRTPLPRKRIGGIDRNYVEEGDTGVWLHVEVTWTVEELKKIPANSPPAQLTVHIVPGTPTRWVSQIDGQQDVHFPQSRLVAEGRIQDVIMVPYPTYSAADPDTKPYSRAGKLRIYMLQDDFEAENEVFYVEVVESDDVELGTIYGSRPGSYTTTEETVIEDDETQSVKITRVGSTVPLILENANAPRGATAQFRVAADPPRYDLDLEVRLDLHNLGDDTVVRGDMYSLSDSSPVLVAPKNGTGGGSTVVDIEFPYPDDDRIDNDYSLKGTAVEYALSVGVDNTFGGTTDHYDFTLVDTQKLPRLTVDQATATVMEGGDVELMLTLNRTLPLKYPSLKQEVASGEAGTITLMSADGMRRHGLPIMVDYPAFGRTTMTQTVKATITAATDDMIGDEEMLVVDAYVDGGSDATYGPRDPMYDEYSAVSTITIEDGTQALVYAMPQADLDAAVMAAKDAGMGADGMFSPGEMIKLMGSDLFGSAPGTTVIYSAKSSDRTVASTSVSGGEIMVEAEGKGDAMITIEASATMAAGATIVNPQTEADRASIDIPVSVALEALTVTLEGPDAGMNLIEGMEYTITAMANRAVEMDTMVELVQTDGTASPADYMVEPITISMGESMGTTKLMVVEDQMMENEGNMTEMLTLEGRVGAMKTTNSLMFYLWDEAVPALPIIAQLLLGAFLAFGGYRRYRRR